MGIKKNEYRLQNRNFERYVIEAIDNMGWEQIERVPLDLRTVLHEGGRAAFDKLDTDTLLYVINIVLGRKLAVVIADPEGLDIASFLKLFDGYRNLSRLDTALEVMDKDNVFVLGSYDLVAMLEYFNMVCAGPIYKSMLDYRSGIGKRNKTLQQREQQESDFQQIVKLLAKYEYNKERLKEYKIKEGEWMVLMTLSYQEMRARDLLEDWLDEGHHYHKRYLRNALLQLIKKGLVQRHGKVNRTGINYHLTPAGRLFLNRYIDQVVLNF